MTSLSLTFDFALLAYGGRTRRDGTPAINHSIRIAQKCEELDQEMQEKCKTVALVHDVVEDTKYTLDEVSEVLDLTDDCKFALDCMTRRRWELYLFHIFRCLKSPIARFLKRQDIADNYLGAKLSKRICYCIALKLL